VECEDSKSEDTDQPSDKEKFRAGLNTISSLFTDMVRHAEEMSLTRCPYRDRNDHCTAKFGCRNQDRSGDGVILCKSDDKLDYRAAWDTDSDSNSEPS
jgi:hypothetical protein